MPNTIQTERNAVISTNLPGIKLHTITDIKPDPDIPEPPVIPEGLAVLELKVDGYDIEGSDVAVTEDGTVEITMTKASE